MTDHNPRSPESADARTPQLTTAFESWWHDFAWSDRPKDQAILAIARTAAKAAWDARTPQLDVARERCEASCDWKDRPHYVDEHVPLTADDRTPVPAKGHTCGFVCLHGYGPCVLAKGHAARFHRLADGFSFDNCEPFPSVPAAKEETMNYDAVADACIAERFPDGFNGGGYTSFQIEQIWRNGFSAAWMKWKLRRVSVPAADQPRCTVTVMHESEPIPSFFNGDKAYTSGPCYKPLPCPDHPVAADQPVRETERKREDRCAYIYLTSQLDPRCVFTRAEHARCAAQMRHAFVESAASTPSAPGPDTLSASEAIYGFAGPVRHEPPCGLG